jgi:hypothetical protein
MAFFPFKQILNIVCYMKSLQASLVDVNYFVNSVFIPDLFEGFGSGRI